MEIIYLTHRFNSSTTHEVAENLDSARWWLTHLQIANPDVAFVSQWMLEIYLGVNERLSPYGRSHGMGRSISIAGCGAFTGIAICGPTIDGDCLSEARQISTRSHTDTPTIHRFSDRGQDPRIPNRNRYVWFDSSESKEHPWWLRRYKLGSVPVSVDLTKSEISEAIRIYADEPKDFR